MKKTKVVMSAGLVLAAVFALTLLGCPHETEEDTIDSRLVASWTNGKEGGLKKEFTIEKDGTFKASINPAHVGAYNEALAGTGGEAAANATLIGLEAVDAMKDATTRWAVTGELVKDEGDLYLMNDLHEKNGRPANYNKTTYQPEGSAEDVIGVYSGTVYVKIVFAEGNDDSFTFTSGDSLVNDFFGGTYTKKNNL